jgi:hypothetical protein
MALRQLTRLVLRLAEKDSSAALFITVHSLDDQQRAFLTANGVTLQESVYDYTFPAFYDMNDVAELRQLLRDSCVAPPRPNVL